MTLEIHLPESLAKNAREYAEREHITVDALIATALAAQLDNATPRRPTIAERAARVDWDKVDAILARVPAIPDPAEQESCIVREEPPKP